MKKEFWRKAPQWAEGQACPPCSEEKGRKWTEFKEMNLNSHEKTSLL